MKYKLYGFLHRNAKRLLHRSVDTRSYRMFSVNDDNIDVSTDRLIINDHLPSFINEITPVSSDIKISSVYPVENICEVNSMTNYEESFVRKCKCKEKDLGVPSSDACALWMSFIKKSIIPAGYRNSGLHYAGYIYECEQWCLPSWIWTNAALVRMYCLIGKTDQAIEITDKLLKLQESCGGWIVRYDYDSEGAVPVLAPNDSAYIATNAFLSCYRATKESKYLLAAEKCADWIAKTSRPDGMVYIGYDTKRKIWDKSHNIVDVGFTAGLFAGLYEITGKEEYKVFLKTFVDSYINLYYIPDKCGFATGIDKNDKQIGGMFGRGQAWALEGLIPAYKVLQEASLKSVIDDTVNMLLSHQTNGAWPYNMSKLLMGIDCKATAAIACSLINWCECSSNKEEIHKAAHKAYEWCVDHTSNKGLSKGGIFSYTIEGAIVHNMYTCTALVYSSGYAIELNKLLFS